MSQVAGDRAQCLLGVSRVTRVSSRRSGDVRYASNTDRIDASQQNVARCQSRPNAPQQTASLFDHLVGQCD
jgi:hypothetical protein